MRPWFDRCSSPGGAAPAGKGLSGLRDGFEISTCTVETSMVLGHMTLEIWS
jgi:hypothetical protein